MTPAQLHAAQQRLDDMAPADATDEDEMAEALEGAVRELLIAFQIRQAKEVRTLVEEVKAIAQSMGEISFGMEVDRS